jgi:hypothetical protein
MASHSTREQIFLTHGTIAHILPRLAVVVIKQKGINAHSAIVTVRKIFPPADATKATFFAVVWILVRGHPQITNVAVVCSKLNPTVYAIVSFARLSSVAFSTNHFFDGKSINVVMSLFVIKICGK